MRFILTCGIILLVFSCKKDRIFLKSEHGFPDTPKNLSLFNSEFDDYNSDLEPGVYDINTLVFSSSRNSQGNEFDIILFSLGLSYPFEEDIVSIYESPGVSGLYLNIKRMQSTINSSDNEYGPYIFNCNLNNDIQDEEFIFFFAHEENNKLDIKYMINELDLSEHPSHRYKWSGPYDVNFVNTEENSEAYISLDGNMVYYCSNDGGYYNIYQKNIPSDIDIIDFLNHTNDNTNIAVVNVNSDSDDKCPYILDDFMVFVSNRPGGFGGYDLWYSKRINNEWSEPANFGNGINSEFDEYRPVVVKYGDIRNDLMIFSSNRPGGFGGFDLYYTGIDETRE